MLAVTLTVDEKIAAAHGDVRVPRSTIRGVRVEPDALAAVSGLRTHPALPIISTEHAEQIAEQIRTGAAHAAPLPRTVLEGFPGHATVAATV